MDREINLEYRRMWSLANRDKESLYAAKWRKKNPEKTRESSQKWKRNNPDRIQEYCQRYRLLCLEHYGGSPPKCACCGEKILSFLDLDHIKNNGAAHRKELGCKGLFKDLVQKNFPKGFQVLCRNCNWGKYLFGKCPHGKQ